MLQTDLDVQCTFKALADPTRRGILMLLREKEMTIAELSQRFDMTRAAVKKHLNVLEKGQLISVHVQGRECINRFEAQGMLCVTQWLTEFNHFWDQRLGKLQLEIEKEAKHSKN